MKKKDIKFVDTALGWLVNVWKWEYEAIFCLSSHDKQKILKWLSNVHDAAEDLVGKVEDAGNKNGTTTLQDIRNVDGKWGSNVQGNGDGDITVVENKDVI